MILNDSVGISQYRYLYFHPHAASGDVELGEAAKAPPPFTLPLGALIPLRTDRLLL